MKQEARPPLPVRVAPGGPEEEGADGPRPGQRPVSIRNSKSLMPRTLPRRGFGPVKIEEQGADREEARRRSSRGPSRRSRPSRGDSSGVDAHALARDPWEGQAHRGTRGRGRGISSQSIVSDRATPSQAPGLAARPVGSSAADHQGDLPPGQFGIVARRRRSASNSSIKAVSRQERDGERDRRVAIAEPVRHDLPPVEPDQTRGRGRSSARARPSRQAVVDGWPAELPDQPEASRGGRGRPDARGRVDSADDLAGIRRPARLASGHSQPPRSRIRCSGMGDGSGGRGRGPG